jgi:acyl-CoA reductase-like NAD-dependent aldehyde dehydrogenase
MRAAPPTAHARPLTDRPKETPTTTHTASRSATAILPDSITPATRSEPESITITDPRDGSPVGTMTAASAVEVTEALAAARSVSAGWAAATPAARGAALHAAADALERAADELAALNGQETGRPGDEARAGVVAGVGTLRQYAELGPLHRTHSLRGARTAVDYTVPEPRGVVAAITPWNDPVAVAVGLIGAALVTGNVVLHKPSERVPHLGHRLGEVLAAAFPTHVLQTLTGGAPVGAALAGSPEVDVVAHVGSTAAGRQIAAAAAATGAHVLRENGGNDVLLVDADVDPEWAAAQAALGAYANAGQICTSVERILVHAALAAPFLDALVIQARDRNHQGLAPLVDRRLRTEVHRQVTASLADGAALLAGGKVPDGPGAHYPATVVADCPPGCALLTEETFGPVAPVRVVADFAVGLAEAAGDRYGLAATVLSGSLAHVSDAIAALPVGTVKVNAVFGGAPGGAAQPRGDSGSGYGYGPELLDEMTTRKVVHIGRPVLRSPTP